MSTSESKDERDFEPLQAVYPFNAPGEAIELYSGPLGGLYDDDLDGAIRLIPWPSPDLRWQMNVPRARGFATVDRVGKKFDLTSSEVTGISTVSSASFESVAGISSNLSFEAGDPLVRVLVHWMNLPDYAGNARLLWINEDGSKTWTAGRLTIELEGWNVTFDGRPDNGSLFKEDVGLARYVLTHVMELRRMDDAAFDVKAAEQMIEALRLSLSFAAGRWVAPTLTVGFDASGDVAWRWWLTPVCDPYQRIGSPIISPRVFSDLERFLKASVAKLHDGNSANTTRFQTILATQTSHLGFVENRIFSAFPAIENLSWEIFVLGGLVSKSEFEDSSKWPTARRLRELLDRAKVPLDVDGTRLPALHQLAIEKSVDGAGAVTWVRNRLIHPKSPDRDLYQHDSLVAEAWMQSREYISLLLLHAIGYAGGYLSSVPRHGFLGDPVPVPWVAP